MLEVVAEKITRIYPMGRGEALGFGNGFVLSILLIFVINKHPFGWTFIYSVDWLALAVSFPLVCAAALLAAVPAAQLVFRARPPRY